MKEIVFVTNNAHKLEEINGILGSRFKVKSLKEIGFDEDIAEIADTLEGNALLKSSFIFKKFNVDCFADDTGLEVESLNGEPGVYSARYAGPENDALKNTAKLLHELKNSSNRKAQFRTVISLILNGKEHQFEGIIKGDIAIKRSGNMGFGYDPIFIPKGYNQSFAEMTIEQKNTISHRALATEKLAKFLSELEF
jgi:XTP/dITP diphosphohydrolase